VDLGLAGHRYLLTGASRGLGLATARHLVADGAHVLLVARDAGRLADAARELAETGPGAAHLLAGDLADPGLPDRALAAARDLMGGLDGAVLSVGGPPPGATADITDDQWRAAFEQVHLGPLRLARAILLQAEQPVSVTFVLSTSVRTPIAGLAVSNGLRPGLAMAAKTMADEFGPRGHRVNVVLPGRIDTDRVRELDAATGDADGTRAAATERIPLRRYGRPEEFGAVAAFVTSPAASYVTGAVVTVDGGMTRSL
jgi:3-oxoacyl-[acyl-carrier protein] reductase